MYRDAGPPNWKIICINFQCRASASLCIYPGPKNSTDDHTDGRKDVHIILPLGGFEPLACDRMRCTQLQAVSMNFHC